MPVIFDNIDKKLVGELNHKLAVAEKADMCVGYFNLRGWKEIDEHIETWSGEDGNCCRVLVGMQRLPKDLVKDYFSQNGNSVDNKTAIEIKKRLALEFRHQLIIGIPKEADEKGLRRLSHQLKSNKVRVKLYLKHDLHAKLYLIFFDESQMMPRIGYLGSSNLTFSGLSRQGELNIDVRDEDATAKLTKWFQDRWENRWCLDISKELAEIIDESWAGERLLQPYYVYLKMAYHLSREARAGLSEFTIPKEFRNYLLEFQQKAVLVAAHHLNKRGGVMIGDVVGLGKTITATALAKLFQNDFGLETLIICPKNLVEMWEDYAHEYMLMATKVLSITQVQKKLPELRRYRLVIIDESHNLRNREGKRYKVIQEYIQLNGSKVILLSATPYNKAFLDLSNQLRLFIPEEIDLGISPEQFINSIGGSVQYSIKFPQLPPRSLSAFEKSEFVDDWRELMRLYLVRRTRSFIKNNYAKTDPDNNRRYLEFSNGNRSYFTDRIPKRVEYDFDPDDPNDQYAKLYSDEVVDIINNLNLPRYGLKTHLKRTPSIAPTPEELVIQDNLSRAGKRLMGFCRTNLFKRLESSGFAFLLSISRHIIRNYIFYYALKNKLPIPIGSQEANVLDDFLEDEDLDNNSETDLNLLLTEEAYLSKAEQIYNLLADKYSKRFKWIRGEFFSNRLKNRIRNDSLELLKVLDLGKDWNSQNDRQLNALFQLINVTHSTQKLLIFTQYADTANYLYKELKRRGVTQIESVTGSTDNPTEFAQRFSPISNKKEHLKGSDKELRVLITTDVLSEGHNLQDGHIILNYDLPWAIIRLIQRAGRVDRIGQQSSEIYCYSFLPEDGVNRIIRLRERLTRRLRENAETVGADEVFFDGDTVNIHDIYTEKSGILEEEGDDEVDLASFAYQIWKNASDANPKLKNIVPRLPEVVYATKAKKEAQQEGVLVYSKTASDYDLLTYLDTNGEVVTQSQLAILRHAACHIDTPALEKIDRHHELVEIGIEKMKDMEKTIGGQLGRKNSAKYRAYKRLSDFNDHIKNTLFPNKKLEEALDDLYRYPLRASAVEKLNRQLRAGIQDEQLSELVISLKEQDKLSIVHEEKEEDKLPQIICSLGLKNIQS